MKKKGFTLAEVLVTLGIIGVVAALAMPALNSAVQRTKVGPSLRKFMNALENANRIVMQEDDINDLNEGTLTTPEAYVKALHKQFASGSYEKVADGKTKGIATAGTWVYTLGSGEEFFFKNNDTKKTGQASTNYKGEMYEAVFDMNGLEVKPNVEGKDTFHFWVDRNGAVIPKGGKVAGIAYGSANDTASTNDCYDATKPCTQDYAAGVIANSNWKVPYKY